MKVNRILWSPPVRLGPISISLSLPWLLLFLGSCANGGM